jgi:hypothetical protein
MVSVCPIEVPTFLGMFIITGFMRLLVNDIHHFPLSLVPLLKMITFDRVVLAFRYTISDQPFSEKITECKYLSF